MSAYRLQTDAYLPASRRDATIVRSLEQDLLENDQVYVGQRREWGIERVQRHDAGNAMVQSTRSLYACY